MCDQIKWHERTVSGTVDGRINAVFKCRWWSKDVEVEMISPYQGERGYSHLPHMVPTKFGEGPGCLDWQHTAWRLVRKALEENKWKDVHREVYEKRLKESRRLREEFLGEIEKLKDGLAEARRTRVGGWCGAVLYGSKVKQLKTEMREWEEMAMEEEEWRWLPKLMEKHKEVTK